MSASFKPEFDSSLETGSGCLVLFALPFVGGGILSLVQGFRELQSTSPDENFWILFVVGGLFSAVGLGLIALVIFGRRKLAEEEKLKQEYPDSPWLWKREWKSGRIRGSGRVAMYTAWGFAAFWNAISFPSAISARDDILRGDEPLLYLILMFPAIGIGLLWWAIKATVRYRKFGSAYLQLATLPGAIGGRVAGRVETRMARVPPGGGFVSLASARRVKRGKNTSEITLWQDEVAVPPQRIGRGPEGVFIPVEFHIPADGEPTTVDSSRSPITWRLTASAELPGVDFESSFEVPVFRTLDPEAVEKTPSSAFHSASGSRVPVTPTWTERMSERGGKEFYFRPAQNWKAAIAGTLFAIVWGTAFWILLNADLPIVFPIVWGFFELVILWAVVDSWTGTTRVTIDAQGISVLRKALGMGRAKTIACADVGEVRVELASQNTQQAGTKAYYKVEIVDREGNTLTAAASIKGKPVAREFARLLEEAVAGQDGRNFRNAWGKI